MGRAEGIFQGKETEKNAGEGRVNVDEIQKVSGREDFPLIFSQKFYC